MEKGDSVDRLIYDRSMTSRPASDDGLRMMVICLGVKTDYWDLLMELYPSISNCCLDVREAFHREWDEAVRGSGFDEAVRCRMKRKDAWDIVMEAAMCILKTFDLLVVVCNHGRHRSLSLGVEISSRVGCELVSPRDGKYGSRSLSPHLFISNISSRLDAHRLLFERAEYPISGFGVCECDFDGPEWMNSPGEGERTDPQQLHVLRRGDLAVWTVKAADLGGGDGWVRGSIMSYWHRKEMGGSDVTRAKWMPASAIKRLDHYHFQGVYDLEGSLSTQWRMYQKNIEQADDMPAKCQKREERWGHRRWRR